MRYCKYNNKKTVVDGITFDSKKEAKRYEFLRAMQKTGDIANLELQPVFVLQQAFKFNGQSVREIKYVADFRYQFNGKIYVEDTKGFKTEAYKLKRKMLLRTLPAGTIFVET